MQEVVPTPERDAGVAVADLTRALSAIPERQRRALLLREWQGLSYAEIADELGVSLAAVETLLFRARRSVAEQLEQSGSRWNRGALASLVAVLRELFGGAAAPLKLAAVGVAAATATTLAVLPATHRQHGAPPPLRAAPHATHVPAGAPPAQRTVRPHRVAPARVTKTTSVPPSPAKPSTAGTAATPATTHEIPPPTPPRAGGDLTSPPSVIPKVDVPETTLLPTATTPAVSLPEVAVPQVELPVAPPALPDLPGVNLP